jgi:hypothetical protein
MRLLQDATCRAKQVEPEHAAAGCAVVMNAGMQLLFPVGKGKMQALQADRVQCQVCGQLQFGPSVLVAIFAVVCSCCEAAQVQLLQWTTHAHCHTCIKTHRRTCACCNTHRKPYHASPHQHNHKVQCACLTRCGVGKVMVFLSSYYQVPSAQHGWGIWIQPMGASTAVASWRLSSVCAGLLAWAVRKQACIAWARFQRCAAARG